MAIRIHRSHGVASGFACGTPRSRLRIATDALGGALLQSRLVERELFRRRAVVQRLLGPGLSDQQRNSAESAGAAGSHGWLGRALPSTIGEFGGHAGLAHGHFLEHGGVGREQLRHRHVLQVASLVRLQPELGEQQLRRLIASSCVVSRSTAPLSMIAR